jgi:hypothetical protein
MSMRRSDNPVRDIGEGSAVRVSYRPIQKILGVHR